MVFAALAGLLVCFGFLALWLAPLALAVVGLARRPGARPLGPLYWTAFGMLAVHLVAIEVMLGLTLFVWTDGYPLPSWYPCLMAPAPIVLLLLLANTLWVRGQGRIIPPDAGEEERRDFMDRLKRRLWIPLLAVLLLEILPSAGPLLPWVWRPAVVPSAGSPFAAPTATSGVGQASTIVIPAEDGLP